jgi:putative effector of murein hydrolase
MMAMLAGGITSILVAVGVLQLMGSDVALIRGMYAKSVTAPIAMGIAERLHASPTLTAVFAVTTGVLGAVLGRFILNAVKVRAWWQRGFALGVAALRELSAFIQWLAHMRVLAWGYMGWFVPSYFLPR